MEVRLIVVQRERYNVKQIGTRFLKPSGYHLPTALQLHIQLQRRPLEPGFWPIEIFY